jgi:hypothetical protein
MTSWSLMILLIHLWLTAFIVFYFYSIDRNTRMYALLSFLFGPFSCSKAATINNTTPSAANQNTLTSKLITLCFRNHRKSSNTAPQSTQFTLPLPKPVDIDQDEIEPSIQLLLVPSTSSSASASVASTSDRASRTYCANKAQCQMPSHEVGADAERWRAWIHTHVPRGILFLIKFSWLLYGNIITSATLVTIGYFSFMSIGNYEFDSTWVVEIGNLHRHGFNSLVAVVDLVLLAYPVRIMHFVYTAGYGWLYALVTFVFWCINTRENIVYEQLDYNKPFQVVFYYALLTLLTFLMQLLHFFAYQLKVSLRERYIRCRMSCTHDKQTGDNCV